MSLFSDVGDLIFGSDDDISRAEANDQEIRETNSPWNDDEQAAIDDDDGD